MINNTGQQQQFWNGDEATSIFLLIWGHWFWKWPYFFFDYLPFLQYINTSFFIYSFIYFFGGEAFILFVFCIYDINQCHISQKVKL